MDKYSGSCGCGAIEYTLNSKIKNVVNCHCNMCRSHNGAAYSTYAALPFNALEITKGNELIVEYKLGSGNKRFCKDCGTPLFNTNEKYPGACMVYLGTLENSRELTPMVNVWCESKLKWVDEMSSIHSFEKGIERK